MIGKFPAVAVTVVVGRLLQTLLLLLIPYHDGGINMILAAFVIWSLMKRKFSRVVTVAVAVAVFVSRLRIFRIRYSPRISTCITPLILCSR